MVAVAGRSQLCDEQLHQAGISAAYPLDELEPDVTRSMAYVSDLLRRVGGTIADHWLSRSK